MNQTEKNKIFQNERHNADESLGAERKKTNTSIIDAQTKTEEKTDLVVKTKRHEVDKATSSARNETDASLEVGDTTELQSERNLADRSVEIERSYIDAAIDQERHSKKEIVAKLLNLERQLTDQNLSIERFETDSEIVRASSRLSSEMAEHSKTKTTLTSREDFLAIVSHDLKNPIGAASSCAAMLLEESAFADMAPDTIKNWLELIKRNVDSSLRLIGDLLDMERIAQDKLQLNFEKHNVDGIIRECLESFVYLAAAKSVLLRNSSPKIAVEISCDHDRTMQILSNLIGNAIKFTPEGGTVTLGMETTNAGVQIFVRDSGSGIPEEKQLTIFERFKQLKNNERKGLGLGLYISKNLVEAHNGRIWVKSKVGEGSTFFFFIPNQTQK